MTEDKSIPTRIQGQAAFDRLKSLMVAHGDYTYRVFEDVALGETDLTQSIFTGSLWRGLRCHGTIFARCDFDGMQVEQCDFEGAAFANTDIRSTAFARCRFRRCRFDGALIDTCSFDECVFDACTFDSAVQRASTYSGCELHDLSIQRSSITKCRFDQSRMHRLMLADCTFLYVIMRGCELRDVTLNVESIGTVFGISQHDLSQLNFVHLGRTATPVDSDDLADVIVRTFESQRWSLSLAITRINFRLTSIAYATNTYLRDQEDHLRAGRRPRFEELSFLLDVFAVLFEEHRLPVVCLSNLADVLQDLGRAANGAADHRLTIETVRDLTARTSSLAQSALDRLAESVGAPELSDESSLLIECRYLVPPRLNLSTIMEQATVAGGLPLLQVPVRIAERTGSYVEVIQACLASAFALQILLYALNGVIVQLTELKERIRVLRQRTAPRKFQVLARTGRQPLPAALRQPVRRLLGFAASHALLQQPDLGGIDERNFDGAKVVESIHEGIEQSTKTDLPSG